MTGYQPGPGRDGRGRPDRYGDGAGSPGSRPPGAPARGAGPRSTGYAGDGRPRAGDRRPGGARTGGGHPAEDYRAAGYPGSGYGEGAGRYGGHRSEPERSRGQGRRRSTGGADGNERLTALTGALLLVLLAAEGFTILSVHRLLTLHFFLGMLLVGPVLLKAGSTGYRFARYYTGVADYRRKGPPAPLLRLLGPFVLATSVAVIGSGIMLAVTGPAGQLWIFVHKASFVLWFGAMSIHVLAYLWRLPHLITGDLATRAGARARDVLAGRPARWLLLTASLLAGLLLALVTYHQAGAWAGFAGGG
jgi:hypothetical protein